MKYMKIENMLSDEFYKVFEEQKVFLNKLQVSFSLFVADKNLLWWHLVPKCQKCSFFALMAFKPLQLVLPRFTFSTLYVRVMFCVYKTAVKAVKAVLYTQK